MNARVNFSLNQPKKILLSNKTNFDLNAEFFKDCDYEILNETDIHKIVEKYRNTDITSILIEAGPKLVNSFLDSGLVDKVIIYCLLYTSPSPRDGLLSRMPSSA